MDQTKLDDVKRVLTVPTETDAIDAALDDCVPAWLIEGMRW